MMRFYTLTILLLLAMASCTQQEEVCLRSITNPCVVDFYTYLTDSTGTPKKTLVSLEAASLVVLVGESADTIMPWSTVSRMEIPLSPFRDSTVALLYLDSVAIPDSLTLYYTREEVFVDVACGMAQLYHLDSLRPSRFRVDSALIAEPRLQLNNSDVNVEIIL